MSTYSHKKYYMFIPRRELELWGDGLLGRQVVSVIPRIQRQRIALLQLTTGLGLLKQNVKGIPSLPWPLSAL